MPVVWLESAPVPTFEHGVPIVCDIVGTRLSEGKIFLYLRITGPLGAWTYYITEVSVAYRIID